jgi:Fe-S-cluster-containing hydrogenase component 2
MASFNDGEDPHFRKASLKAVSCPSDCPQPCLQVCPIQAISKGDSHLNQHQIVIHPQLCFGCGRCEPVCPYQQIQTLGYELPAAQLLPELINTGITGIEIHTQAGRQEAFQRLWDLITPWIPRLEVVSISLGDHPELTEYLQDLVQILHPLPSYLIWQADGRPMSGDIGAGTTHATLKLAKKLIDMKLPGKIQLAGGTNQHTIPSLASKFDIGGVAYGSYARTLIQFVLEEPSLSQRPDLLDQAVYQARQLVNQVKTRAITPDRIRSLA